MRLPKTNCKAQDTQDGDFIDRFRSKGVHDAAEV
jgi:hypothetical protein